MLLEQMLLKMAFMGYLSCNMQQSYHEILVTANLSTCYKNNNHIWGDGTTCL